MASLDNVNAEAAYAPTLPFSISCLITGNHKRYMLYDIDLITWLRREYHILGVLVGSLPQAPSQNVFLGLPLELMPEEARLLIEKGLAYLVDDRKWHLDALRKGAEKSKINAYQAEMTKKGLDAADDARQAKEMKMVEIMKKLSLNNDSMKIDRKSKVPDHRIANSAGDSLFEEDTVTNPIVDNETQLQLKPFAISPVTAGSLQPEGIHSLPPDVDASSYAVFKKVHQQGYYLSPGLRFGCQYMAYPGDPLRYHSHFLVLGADWDTGINLIDVIGSGRLATGVKKSFLLGGIEPSDDSPDTSSTRAFSIEWAGM